MTTDGDSARWRRCGASSLTLLFGALGGLLFFSFAIPLPWLLGPMVVTVILTLSTGRTALNPKLTEIAKPILGTLVGSAFVPEIIDQIVRWPGPLAFTLFYMVSGTLIGTFYFRKIAGFDLDSAIFAATPGGFAELLSIISNLNLDLRRLILSHSIRIAFVVFTVPWVMLLFFDVDVGGITLAGQEVPPLELQDWAILGGVTLIGALLGPKLKLPGEAFFIAMLLSAAAHLTGLTHAAPPWWLVAIAQILLGVNMGMRFKGLTRLEAVNIGGYALGWGSFLIAYGLLLATLAGALFDGDVRAYFLAFAPGGFSEMMLLTLALGVETAFVATSHTVRLLSIVLIVPNAHHIFRRRWPRR